MSSLKTTVREALRYRGSWGHWSWVAHRISGLGILAFLIIHVWDTANAAFWPEMYEYTVQIFKWLPFSVSEVGLMAVVLYHAFNGVRISILDFKPELWRHQETSAKIVWVLFLIVFIPAAYLMLESTFSYCVAHNWECTQFPKMPPGLIN